MAETAIEHKRKEWTLVKRKVHRIQTIFLGKHFNWVIYVSHRMLNTKRKYVACGRLKANGNNILYVASQPRPSESNGKTKNRMRRNIHFESERALIIKLVSILLITFTFQFIINWIESFPQLNPIKRKPIGKWQFQSTHRTITSRGCLRWIWKTIHGIHIN